MLTLLTMVLTALTSTAQESAVTNYSGRAATRDASATEYKVFFEAGPGGKITKHTYQNPVNYQNVEIQSGDPVPAGAMMEFNAEPEDGYEIEGWTINGDSRGPSAMIFPTVNEEMHIKVTFKKPQTFKVHFAFEGEHGNSTMTANYPKDGWDQPFNDGAELPEGVLASFIVTLDNVYEVEKWIVNGETEFPDRTFPHILRKYVRGELDVKAVLKKGTPKYNVTLGVGQHGNIKGQYVDEDGANRQFFEDTQMAIPEGTKLEIRAIPNIGYMVDRWNTTGSTPLTPSPDDPNLCVVTVTEPMAIHVTFKEGKSGYDVTYSAGEHGTIEKAVVWLPDGETKFKSGENLPAGQRVELKAKPDKGYEVDKWTVKKGDKEDTFTGVNEYSAEVEGKMDIQVTFKKAAPAEYPVNWTVDGGTLEAKYQAQGSDEWKVIENGGRVVEGTELTLTVKPEENKEVKEWVINSAVRDDLAGQTTTKVTVESAMEIEVECVPAAPQPKAYKLTYSVSPKEQGVLKVTNAETKEAIASGADVAEGTKVTCQVEISEGSKWQLEKWMVGGKEYTEGAKNATITLTVDKNLEIQAVLKDHTSIEAPAESRYVVSLQDGELMIQGLTAPTAIYLYNTTGELILSRLMDATPISLHSLPHGVYYLVVEGNAYKVVK